MIKNKRVLMLKLTAINGLNSSVLRALALTKGLQEIGYKVDWVSIHASSTQVINERTYDFLDSVDISYANRNMAYESLIKGESKAKKTLLSVARSLYKKFAIYNHTKAIADSIKIDILNCTEYEYIISVSDPKTSHIAMQKLIEQGLKYNKWIQYWGDPMTLDITKQSVYPSFVYKTIEEKLIRGCDRIVYTSPLTLKMQKQLFKNQAKLMTCVPTAYIEDKHFPEKSGGDYTIGYFGTYTSFVRNIHPFYDACNTLDAKTYIIGDADFALDTTDKVTVLPRGDISKYEEITDLFICILNSSGSQIPGKVYHDAAYNKPVLVILDGEYSNEIREYLNQFNRYYFCNNTMEEIVESIKSIREGSKTFEPCRDFSAKEVARKVIDF